jgi:hypothetical protein
MNRARRPGVVSVELTRHGQPFNHATISVTYHSLDMPMPNHNFDVLPAGHGQYSHAGPHLAIGGRWRITITIATPRPRIRLNLTDLISL